MHDPEIPSLTTVFQGPNSAEIPPPEIVHSTASLVDGPSAKADGGTMAAALREADLVTEQVEELQNRVEAGDLLTEVTSDVSDRAAYNTQVADEYVAFRGILTNYVKRNTGASAYDVEDAVQEAFLAALRLEQDTPPGRSFYFKVAFRVVMRQWYKGNEIDLLGEDIPRLSEEDTYNIETMEWVNFALLRISAPERELAGRLLLGQRGREVAKWLDIPEREARRRIEALRKKLAEMAHDEGWR